MGRPKNKAIEARVETAKKLRTMLTPTPQIDLDWWQAWLWTWHAIANDRAVRASVNAPTKEQIKARADYARWQTEQSWWMVWSWAWSVIGADRYETFDEDARARALVQFPAWKPVRPAPPRRLPDGPLYGGSVPNGVTATIQDGRSNFDARRKVIAKLIEAEDAMKELLMLGTYRHDLAGQAFGQILWARGRIAGMLPNGAMPMIAAQLSDSEDPYYASWDEAEPQALARIAPDIDAPTVALAKGIKTKSIKDKGRRRSGITKAKRARVGVNAHQLSARTRS